GKDDQRSQIGIGSGAKQVSGSEDDPGGDRVPDGFAEVRQQEAWMGKATGESAKARACNSRSIDLRDERSGQSAERRDARGDAPRFTGRQGRDRAPRKSQIRI